MPNSMALIVLLAVSGVSAHSWLTSPVPWYLGSRLGNRSTTAPCGGNNGDPSENGDISIPLPVVRRNGELIVEWFNGNHNGDDFYTLAPSQGWFASAISFTGTGIHDLGKLNHASGTAVPNQNQVRRNKIIIPSTVPDGNYTLQWKWTNYYACSEITVLGDCDATVQVVDFGETNPAKGVPIQSGTSPRTMVSTQSNGGYGEGFRLVITSTSDSTLRVGQRMDRCPPPTVTSFEHTGEGKVCIDLPKNNDVKYYQIQGTGTVDVEVQGRTCAQLSKASSLAIAAGVNVVAVVATLLFG